MFRACFSLLVIREWLDARMSAWLVLIATLLVLLVTGEIGFRVGRLRRPRAGAAESPTPGIALTALLAMLGLIVAFSFSIAESRFAARRSLVLQEANAIGTTYLRAAMLPEPHGRRMQELLREYVDVRLYRRTPDAFVAALEASQRLHREMWAEATAVGIETPNSEVAGLFIESLNNLIDLHTSRVAVGLYARLPWAFVITLYFVSALTQWLLGYAAGAVRCRSPVPTIALALAVSSMITIIVELDRPAASVFQIGRRAIEDVRDMMDSFAPPERSASWWGAPVSAAVSLRRSTSR